MGGIELINVQKSYEVDGRTLAVLKELTYNFRRILLLSFLAEVAVEKQHFCDCLSG